MVSQGPTQLNVTSQGPTQLYVTSQGPTQLNVTIQGPTQLNITSQGPIAEKNPVYRIIPKNTKHEIKVHVRKKSLL